MKRRKKIRVYIREGRIVARTEKEREELFMEENAGFVKEYRRIEREKGNKEATQFFKDCISNKGKYTLTESPMVMMIYEDELHDDNFIGK